MSVSFLAISSFLIASCFGQAGQTGRYPDKYNLIDADPSCRYDIPDDVCCVSDKSAQCPLIYDGPGDEDVMAVHPNIFERVEFLTRNMARLYPSFYIDSEWGFSGSYASNCDQPSTTPTEPFYFMSEATQAGRWNSYSGATTYSGCDRGDACDQQQTSHYTCCDYCEYNTWGQCGYKYRTKGMVQLLFSSNSWNDVGSEGIWCCNTAYSTSSSHCGMVFNYEYEHMGIGYYPSGSTTMVGIKDTDDWEDHVFPHGTHFDWDDSEYTFMVQFYGGKQASGPVYVDQVYLLYDGDLLEMETIVSSDSSSTGTSGFYQLVKSNTGSCEPYAFAAKDTNGNWWRLPEDENYYFSTVSMPDDLVDGSASCNENHYYNTGSQWVANGADGLTNNKNSGNGCVGCSKINALENEWINNGGGTGTATGDDDDDDDNNDMTCTFNGVSCEISSTWWEDGVWCDCPNCEDEPNCECSSSGCPTYCGGYSRGSCSGSRNDGDASRGESSSDDNDGAVTQIIIYTACAVGVVIIILIVSVCIFKRKKLNKQVEYKAMNETKSDQDYQPPQVETAS